MAQQVLRYADRIRSEEALTGGREREEKIRFISNSVLSSEQLYLAHRTSFDALGSGTFLPNKRLSPKDDPFVNVKRSLKADYRKAEAESIRNPDSERAKLKIKLDAANFSRKATAIDGFIEEVPQGIRSSASGTGKPAQLYRKGKAQKLDPPLVVRRRPTKSPKQPSR